MKKKIAYVLVGFLLLNLFLLGTGKVSDVQFWGIILIIFLFLKFGFDKI